MREIKFRAWDKEENEMFECVTVACDKKDKWITLVYTSNHIINSIENEHVVMQYTGLKDKNCKEIYEGDIVTEDEEMYSVCKRINPLGCFAFVPIEMNGESEDNLRGCTEFNKVYEMFTEYGVDTFFDNQTPNKYVEVVGNIYENPELFQ